MRVGVVVRELYFTLLGDEDGVSLGEVLADFTLVTSTQSDDELSEL